MPARTPRQYGAMQAAAHGTSKLGIPRAVGQEFVAKTPPAKRSAFAHALQKVGQRRRSGY